MADCDSFNERFFSTVMNKNKAFNSTAVILPHANKLVNFTNYSHLEQSNKNDSDHLISNYALELRRKENEFLRGKR